LEKHETRSGELDFAMLVYDLNDEHEQKITFDGDIAFPSTARRRFVTRLECSASIWVASKKLR
jgi:sulfate adenylyltransferase subunit 1 (EFTu-like GTPase family)